MDEIKQQLNTLESKVDAVYASTEKTRKYFLTTMIITIAMIVLPIILVVLALPTLMSTLGGAYRV